MMSLETTITGVRNDASKDHLEFWQNGLQVIEEISSSLETSLSNLEKKYSDFEGLYDQVMDRIDALAGIYAGVNTIQGREYVLRLKAMMRDYRKRYTLEGINFNAIHFLNSKIRELRDRSFDDFPRVPHLTDKTVAASHSGPQPIVVRNRWISFQRNGSWFILPYDTLEIVEYRSADLVMSRQTGKLTLRRSGTELIIRDVFSSSAAEQSGPNYLLIIGSGKGVFCYAASKLGKKIFSRRDFITENLEGFPKSMLSRGRIRLFGEKHIYIDPRDSA